MRHCGLLLFLLACSGSDSPDECNAAVQRLETAMQGDVSGSDLLPYSNPDIEVPIHASGRVEVEVAPFIAIGRTELLLDGFRVDAESLGTNLETIGRNYQILHPDRGEWDKRILVLADARVSFERVDEVLRPYIARGYSFVVLAQTPTPPTPPCPSSWPECAELGSGDPADRAVEVAHAMSGALGQGCTEVITLFGRIAGVDSDQKATTLRSGLPDALRSCGCAGVDMERLEWLVPHMLGLHSPRAVGFRYEPGLTGTVGDWVSQQ